MKKFFTLCLALLIVGIFGLPGSPVAFGYEEIKVKSGGTIQGKVSLKGPAPKPRIFPSAIYPFGPFCEKNKNISDGSGNILLKDVVVGADRGLKDVVVIVGGVEKGKRFKPIVVNLISKDCEFLPFVSIVQDRGEFVMKNEDPVIHNSQVYQARKGNVILNVPVPVNSTMRHPIRFEKNRRIYQMICGMHEFMQTWGFAVDNPYYALTKEDGQFRIDTLPPGTYKMTAWHPHLKTIEKEVTVPPEGTVSINFEFDSDKVRRQNYETQEKFRIQVK